MPDSGNFCLPTRLIAACVQTNASADIQTNLDRIEPMIMRAAEKGAHFITLPENVSLMINSRDRLFEMTQSETRNIAVNFVAAMARKTKTWILAGSVAVAIDSTHLANRSFLFDATGQIVARYDKIHMFDADLGEKEIFRESANFRGGDRAVVAPTPWGKIGMTICYDVRFPHLYRALAKAGATIITIPAAFIATTGRMHWHVLVRARAIETGCFVIAPGQCGEHDGGRHTYGHSLIVAPNGEILAEAGDETSIIMADLDLAKVAEARRMLPSLKHDCEFERPVVS